VSQSAGPVQGPADPAARSAAGPSLLAQFFLIPLAVVAIGVAVFILFGLVAREDRSPEAYLSEIRSGTANRRWQAAYELSREIRRLGHGTRPELVTGILSTLEWAENEDPQIRRYLARALGYLGDRRAVPALVAHLRDADDDTRLWSAEALGSIGDSAALEPLALLLDDPDPDIRKQATHSLGSLADTRAIPPLTRALGDATEDVRWNAALALARLGDPGGGPVLLMMIDRTHLDTVPGIRPEQKEIAMVQALLALGEIGAPDGREAIARVERSDPSLRVRQAALHALRRLGAEPAS
jgi:HEAT repeat protein